MKKHNLEFCFKGSRTYVHGTDIFNKVVDSLKNEIKNEKVDLSLHGIAKTNMTLVNEKPEKEDLLKFAFKFTKNDGKKDVVYGIENSELIECKYEYPEEDICKLGQLNLGTE